MPVSIHIENVTKRFENTRALDNVSLLIEPGELFFLLGPSGCGKTTLLRTLAGFYQPDAGTVKIGDRDVTRLPPHVRDTGMVFQSYALWPHMTLAENVAFGLEMRGVPRAEIRSRVAEALKLVHMADRADARPNQLSGGQQQRVALARAIVIHPQCLLLDEPLSNLDAKLRLEMRSEIRRICKDAGLTAVYVTHDQKEALSIADRLAVMRAGKLEQVGAPSEVYRAPANAFVAGFIGEGNFMDATLLADEGKWLRLDTPLGVVLAAPPRGRDFARGEKLTLCVRPESITWREHPAPKDVNEFSAIPLRTVYQGEVAQHELRVGSQVLKAYELNPLGALAPDKPLRVRVAPEHCICLAPNVG